MLYDKYFESHSDDVLVNVRNLIDNSLCNSKGLSNERIKHIEYCADELLLLKRQLQQYNHLNKKTG